MTEFNPSKAKRRLEPGITKLCKVKLRDAEGNLTEHDLYYGNIIFMNNLTFQVKPEMYNAKLSAFLKSPIGKDFERPTTDDIEEAFRLARRPDIVASHKDKTVVKVATAKKEKTSEDDLMAMVRKNTVTPEMEAKEREALAKQAKVDEKGGISLNRLVDEQLKIEHERQEIENEKKRLESERIESERVKAEVHEAREQLVTQQQATAETTERVNEQSKYNEEKLKEIEAREQALAAEQETLREEQETLREEQKKFDDIKGYHQSLLIEISDLERRKASLLDYEQNLKDTEAKNAAEKEECERLLKEAIEKKQSVQSEYETLEEKKNEISANEIKLKEELEALEADKTAYEAERQEQEKNLSSEYDKLNEEKKKFDQDIKDREKELLGKIRNETAKKNYTAITSVAVGLTTASILGCVFMGLCMYGVIPGMNPAMKADSSVLNVVSMKNEVNAGDVITAEDIEMVAVTADQYASMATGKVLKADGTSEDNYAVLWSNANNVIGSYATDNIGKGEYLMSSEYGELKSGDAYVTMVIDGVETKIPVGVTTAGTSKFYAIVTTTDEAGESRNLAVDMGALSLEGRTLVDAVDSNGVSVIENMQGGEVKNEEVTTTENEVMPEVTPDMTPEVQEKAE